nr:hypothetical protein 21 [bacterium]
MNVTSFYHDDHSEIEQYEFLGGISRKEAPAYAEAIGALEKYLGDVRAGAE